MEVIKFGIVILSEAKDLLLARAAPQRPNAPPPY